MMSFLSKVVDWVRKLLLIPLIESDLKTLKESVSDLKTLKESVVLSNLNFVKVRSVMQNGDIKFDSILLELKNALIESNTKLENESRRRKDAEKQLMDAIELLTNKINRIQSIVDQRGESAGSQQEK